MRQPNARASVISAQRTKFQLFMAASPSGSDRSTVRQPHGARGRKAVRANAGSTSALGRPFSGGSRCSPGAGGPEKPAGVGATRGAGWPCTCAATSRMVGTLVGSPAGLQGGRGGRHTAACFGLGRRNRWCLHTAAVSSRSAKARPCSCGGLATSPAWCTRKSIHKQQLYGRPSNSNNNSTSHKQQLYDPQATIPRARAHRAGRVPAKRSCTRRGAALGTRLRRRDTHGELSPFTRATAPWRLACASAAATRCRVTGALTVTVCGAVAARAGAAGGLRLRSCPRGLACGSARGGRRDALTQRAGTACVCLLARLTGRLQADVQTVSHPESVPETTNKCNREGGSRTEAWHAQTGCRAQPAGRPGGGGGRLARPLAMARQAAWPHAPQTCRAQSPEVGGASARGRRGRGCHGRFRTAAEGRCRQCLRMQLRPSLHSRSRPEGDGGWALQTVVTHT